MPAKNTNMKTVLIGQPQMGKVDHLSNAAVDADSGTNVPPPEMTENNAQETEAISENLSDQTPSDDYYTQTLNQKGVGIKPAILLSNEFIPLKAKDSESDEDQKAININFSEGNTVKVTNVVRLIELQNILNKQINKISSNYIIKNAPKIDINLNEEELVLLRTRIFDYYTLVKKMLIDDFDDIFFGNDGKTQLVSNIVNASVEKSIASQDFVDNLDANFLFSLINLIINDVFIMRVNKEIIKIADLKHDHNVMIDFLKLDMTAFNQNTNDASEYFLDIQNELRSSSESIEKNIKKYFLNTDLINLDSLNNKSNLSHYLNCVMRLAKHTAFFDSIKSENEAIDNVFDYNNVNINAVNDLSTAITTLKEIKFPNIISVQNRHPDNSQLEELTVEKINKLLADTGETSKSKQLAELLSMICFDHVAGANKEIGGVFENLSAADFSESIIRYIHNNLMDLPTSMTDFGTPNLGMGRQSISVSNYATAILNDSPEALFQIFQKETDNNSQKTTIPFEIEPAIFSNLYQEQITNNSYDFFVLRDLIVNKNKDLNKIKNYLNNHKQKLEKVVNSVIKTFSLGFDEIGNNKTSDKISINNTNTSEDLIAQKTDGAPPNPDVSFTTKFNYVLDELNPMSFLNYYLETLANDLSLTPPNDTDNNLPPTVNFNSSTLALRTHVYNLLVSAFAGRSVASSLTSFKASFLGTLSELESVYLYEDNLGSVTDKDKQELKNVGMLLDNEVYKNMSSLILDLFDVGNFSQGGYTAGIDYAYIRDYEENVEFQNIDGSTYDVDGSYESFQAVHANGRILRGSIQKSDSPVLLTKIDDINPDPPADLIKINFPNYTSDTAGDPGLKSFLQSIYNFMPTGTVDKVGLYSSNAYDLFVNEDISGAADVNNTMSGVGNDKKRGNGINIARLGNLPQSLLFNYALLNNSVKENENLNFPNIENLSLNIQTQLIKGGYFKPATYPESMERDMYGWDFKSSSPQPSNGVINTNNFHLYLIFHLWSLELINQALWVEIGTSEDRPFVNFSEGRLSGLIGALKNKELEGTESADYVNAYNTAKRMINQVKDKINKRNENILKSLFVFQHQIEKINSYITKLNSTINSIPNNILFDMQNFLSEDTFALPFINTSIKFSQTDYQKAFLLSKKMFPVPTSNILEAENHDLKIMYKLFTTHGHGFLKDSGDTNKKIYHIGISSLLFENLKLASNQESNLICLIVKRHNQININEKTLPKYFIFDMSKYILPKYYDTSTNSEVTANHITNYTDDISYNNLINSIEFLEINGNNIVSRGTGIQSVINNSNSIISNNYSDSAKNKLANSIQKNHILDYYLKLYSKATVELDCNESNYPLRSDLFDENTVDQLFEVQEFNAKVMNDIKNNLEVLTDITDNTLQQAIRVKKNILSTPLFNSNARSENNIYNSGCFERTFSILVDEKDFITFNKDGTVQLDGRHILENVSEENENSIYSFTVEVGLLKRW